MEEIKQMIGFWLISLGICTVCVMIFGFDLEAKYRVGLVIGMQSFIALLEIGLYLMGV